MFCSNCGKEIQEGQSFCPFCGQPVGVANASKQVYQERPNTMNNSLQEIPVANKKFNKENKALKVLKIVGIIFAALLSCFIAFVAWGISLLKQDDANKELTKVANDYHYDMQATTNSSEESITERAPLDSGEQPYGDGTTILVYIVGSNLETNDGSATKDIDEMMSAQFGEDIHLIVQTGGSNTWQNSSVDGTSIDDRYIQRYRVRSGEKELVENLELANMGNAQTLSDFLKWGVDTYPAERYIAILWNHGGGTIGSYGVDEIYDSGMSLPDIKTAFENTGYHFDMIGFDACLMATFETAYALSGYADYLLASEEKEWGYGWYYTDWLTLLGSNPNMTIEDIGKQIIDDYATSIDYVNKMYDLNNIYTLSLMDLTKCDEVYSVIMDCFDEANRKIMVGEFNALSQARSEAVYYGGGSEKAPEGVYAQIDIMDFLTKADIMTDSCSDIICGENGFIAYEKNNYSGSNGVAIYFPYTLAFEDYSGSYDNTSKVLKDIGYEDSYFKFFDSFIGVLADINDLDFTPQYSGDSAETDAQTAIFNNPYTEPVLDEDGFLPIIKDENGYYMIDLSVQPEEFVNNIASIWSSTYIGKNEYLGHVITTPGINEVGHDVYIPYGGLSMRPYPYAHMVGGILTSLTYLCENNFGDTYYITARVNDEEAAIILDSRITQVPNRTTGKMVPAAKVWGYRGYTTSFNEGIPDIRSLRDFKVGDKICSLFRTIDGEYHEFTEHVTLDSEYLSDEAWSYDGWPSTYSSCVVNMVIDTSGKRYYAYAFYPSSDGKYSDYYDSSFSTQHKIEGN
ncbi:MAG: zinc-ribbon domain-containing protein [Lachnospiraceae bacterium]|nr:zinc-ribbon domain-containing protein [Lachnospiraceae bacterium]